MQYEMYWRDFVFPPSESRFRTTRELIDQFAQVDLTAETVTASGIPLHKDGAHVVVNDADENTLIFGETGSKKTRAAVIPLLYSLAAAKQSMIVTDPKGELSADGTVRGLLDKKGYRVHILDFRSCSADGYDLLEYPFSLYRKGQTDKALMELSKLSGALTSPHKKGNIDLYWPLSSDACIFGSGHLLFSVCAAHPSYHRYVNIKTLAGLCSAYGLGILQEMVESGGSKARSGNTVMLLRGILSCSEKTLGNIASVLSSIIQPFLLNTMLTDMMSTSTFDITAFYSEPHALFLVLPDDTDIYHVLAEIILNSMYSRLIDAFTERYQGHRAPPCGITWVLDEFCNIRLPAMSEKISAARSRCQKFVLVCQSKQQLEAAYADAAPSIIGNCKNLLFLQSADVTLQQYISDLCGTTGVTRSGKPEPLVTTGMLRCLRKERTFKEALFIRDDFICRVKLADCDTYALGLEPWTQSVSEPVRPRVQSMTPGEIVRGIKDGELSQPFVDSPANDMLLLKRAAKNRRNLSPTQEALWQKLETLAEQQFTFTDTAEGEYNDAF